MSRPLHMLVVILACVSAGAAPMLGGMVSCTGAGGHHAIEALHVPGGCGGVHHDESAGGERDDGGAAKQEAGEEAGERCTDVRLAAGDFVRSGRAFDHSAVFGLSPVLGLSIASPGLAAASGRGLGGLAAVDPDTSPPMRRGLDRLVMIILLI